MRLSRYALGIYLKTTNFKSIIAGGANLLSAGRMSIKVK